MYLTRLSGEDDQGGSRERQRETGRWICWLCSGVLDTGRHPRLVLRHRARFWFFDIKRKRAKKGKRFFPFVVSSDKPEDDKPDAKR
jgi:hypothetical protein